ncbi:alginate lyase family protein [Uliginosibacterium sp. H3]|uniref:Alginate lyase family protein n=1 Tax=Uliginosibacterium silvisoli TaxID=3114758 RepID=A0ABU6JZD0_9RHOO|nr:alginate lyase family protein [Uliginosibacterium sp. H3]
MNKTRTRLAHGTKGILAAAAIVGSLCSLPALAAAPAVITMDGAYLELARQRIAASEPTLKPAYDKLLQDANAVLGMEPEAVTRKKITPPSGDKHDYLSLAPYWWPDPSKADGLPYIQRDGEFNPSSKNSDTDSVRMQLMCLGTQTMSLAWYFTGEQKYAKKGAEFIRAWFLDPATRMNPNLNFGQAVMGRTNGRGIGLIDTRNMWMVIDAVQLLQASGELSAKEVADMKQWFKDFTGWMLNSDLGIEEFIAHNNHGTFYDMQVANYALFFGDTALAKRTVQRGVDLRIASQISIEGKQYAELERTTPFHYSAFNLDAMTNIARYGEQVKVNVWNIRDKGRGLRNGIHYMMPFALKPQTWPWKELKDNAETELMLPVLLRAERAYGGGAYASAAAALPVTTLNTQEIIAYAKTINTPAPTTLNTVDRLIWPVK